MTQDQQPLPPNTQQFSRWSQHLSPEAAAEVQKALQLQKLSEEANETLISHIASWFFEFGSWIYGGLIAYSIVLIQFPILNSAVTRGDRAAHNLYTDAGARSAAGYSGTDRTQALWRFPPL